MFGTILHRMIFGELIKVFLLALISLTGMFLLGGVVSEAAQRGLSPAQVIMIIPLLIPNTLPYTVPATCLFATCVVYGRLAHDNEITAIKAAGVHLGRLVAPALILGVTMATGIMALHYHVIPATHQTLRTQILGDVDDLLYAQLKRQGCLKHPKLSYAMWVRQVQGKRLIDAIFKEKDEKQRDVYKFVARAREARLHFDPATGKVKMDMSNVTTYGDGDTFNASAADPTAEMDLPTAVFGGDYICRPNDLSWPDLVQKRDEAIEEAAAAERAAAMSPPADLPADKQAEWTGSFKYIALSKARARNGFDAEFQMRPALAAGCVCFVLIGAPVGIWFSRSDYLSTFVSCFLPTIVVYYPLLLCGTNMAKDGRLPAAVGLWMANAAVGLIGLLLYSRLLRR
jgi:lipopolysaccharide export system permease protein